MVIITHCTGSCKSNYHTITITTDPICIDVLVKYNVLIIMYQIVISVMQNMNDLYQGYFHFYFYFISTRIVIYLCIFVDLCWEFSTINENFESSITDRPFTGFVHMSKTASVL